MFNKLFSKILVFKQSLLGIVLLPLVYTIHHLQRFYPFLDPLSLLWSFFKHFSMLVFVWLVIYRLIRNSEKTSALTILSGYLILFFSPTFDSVKQISESYFQVRYSLVLPVLAVLGTFLSISIIRAKGSFRAILRYCYTVMLIFLCIDLSNIFFKWIAPIRSNRIQLVNADPLPEVTVVHGDLPNIYIFVFDEYGSSTSLATNFGYNNSAIDSFLLRNGYFIMKQSRSNYHWTQFSIASLMNLSYLSSPTANRLQFDDFIAATNHIRTNRLIPFLEKNGYEVYNCSAFEFENHPKKIQYLPDDFGFNQLDRDLIWNKINKDIGWNWRDSGKIATDTLHIHAVAQFQKMNLAKTFDYVRSAIEAPASKPKFIYGHFFLPHNPFLYDNVFRERTAVEMLSDESVSTYSKSYLNYLPFVNGKIRELVEMLKKNQSSPSIIVIMGDHGFRNFSQPQMKEYYFQNFFAISLPKEYDPDNYRKITGVNLFRQILSDAFRQPIPHLPDSLFFWHE